MTAEPKRAGKLSERVLKALNMGAGHKHWKLEQIEVAPPQKPSLEDGGFTTERLVSTLIRSIERTERAAEFGMNNAMNGANTIAAIELFSRIGAQGTDQLLATVSKLLELGHQPYALENLLNKMKEERWDEAFVRQQAQKAGEAREADKDGGEPDVEDTTEVSAKRSYSSDSEPSQDAKH